MKTVKHVMMTVFLAAFFLLIAAPSVALAATPSETLKTGVCDNVEGNNTKIPGCADGAQTIDKKNAGQQGAGGGYLETIANLFTMVAGTVAFIFVLVGGIRYITSTGDPKRIQQAKDTLMYAVIGLIVVGLARAIIGFVIGAIG